MIGQPVARRRRSVAAWRAAARAAGPPGNERLTSSTGLLLVVLLALEALTTLALREFLAEHIFLGLLLLAPVGLKLASTGWRFTRYYTHDETYRRHGPPRPLLRVLAPPLVASTLTLFGSGVAMIVVGHGGGVLLSLHDVSFVAWGVVLIVHVLVYMRRALARGRADWRAHAEQDVAGARSRRRALAGALVVGVLLAVATVPAQQAWLSHRHDHAQVSDRPGRTTVATSGIADR
jgi:hypothetical protein